MTRPVPPDSLPSDGIGGCDGGHGIDSGDGIDCPVCARDRGQDCGCWTPSPDCWRPECWWSASCCCCAALIAPAALAAAGLGPAAGPGWDRVLAHLTVGVAGELVVRRRGRWSGSVRVLADLAVLVAAVAVLWWGWWA